MAHGGAHSMELEMSDLMGLQVRPNYELPGVILSALTLCGWVVEVVSQVLPNLAEEIGIDDEWAAQMNFPQDMVSREAQNQFGH